MPHYLHPGVYLEEVPGGARPIEGTPTSVAAFIGQCSRGPVNELVLAHGLFDYQRVFGAPGGPDDKLGLAATAFYWNGGKDAYFARAAGATNTPATCTLVSEAEKKVVDVAATSPGPWANALWVKVENPTNGRFDLVVGHKDDPEGEVIADEVLSGVSVDPASDQYLTRIASELVKLRPGKDADGLTLPKEQGAALKDGAVAAPDNATYDTILSNLKKAREVSVLVLPGVPVVAEGKRPDAVTLALAHCEETGSRMLILDPPADKELASAADVPALGLPTSTYAVMYYPNVKVQNPAYRPGVDSSTPATVLMGPSAFAAGMWSRIDGRRGVWKAPAGVEASLNGVAGFEFRPDDGEQDQLNPLGINCLRTLPTFGPVIWGARTLATKAAPEWRYLPVRRTAIMIEQSVYNGIQWAVFEPNDHKLWSALRAAIGSFMDGLFRAGAFQGEKASDAYFVRCGLGDTMTQDDIDRGQVVALVGFAPLKPAEFVIVRIQQKVQQQ